MATKRRSSSSFGTYADGIILRGMPLLTTYPGDVYWADSGGGGSKGTFASPDTSISDAMARCTSGNGDIIMCKPGHQETISAAAGLVCDKANVAIVGTGTGSNQAKIVFDTADTADIDVTASGVTFYGMWIYVNFANVDGCFDVAATGTYFTMQKCRWTGGSATLDFEEGINLAAAANYFSFIDNDVRVLTAGDAESLVFGAGECVDITVTGNFIAIPATAAIFDFDVGNTTGAPLFMNNTMINLDTTTGICVAVGAGTVATFVNENYGAVKDNVVPAADLTLSYCINCHGVDLADRGSLLWPSTATNWTA